MQPQWLHVSEVDADITARILLRGAGILTVGSLILAQLLPSESAPTAQEAILMAVLTALGSLLLVFGPRWLKTTAKVGEYDIFLSSAGIRARLPLAEVESVVDSHFPSGGYGYRYLGKGHRGYISGGTQVDIGLKNGREYTVSVQSADEFRSAICSAQARIQPSSGWCQHRSRIGS